MAAERRSGDLGSTLRDARERKGVSLRTIADDTKISIASLEALERNDISRLPGGIFSRAFVRAFAGEVGLDPEAAVEEFVRQFPHNSVTDGHPPSRRIDPLDSPSHSRRAVSLGVKALAILVPLAALAVYLWLAARHAPRGSDPTLSTLPVVAPTAESSTDAASGTAPAPPVGRLRVEVVARRSCALSSSLDGQVEAAVVFEPPGRRTFDVERELLLTITDGDAVDWSINGARSRPLGPPGEPASIQLTTENYREFLDIK